MSYSKTIPAKFPFGQRSFLKATFFDDEKQLLVSKSILRDDMPAVRHRLELCFARPSRHLCKGMTLSSWHRFKHVTEEMRKSNLTQSM